MIVFGNVCSALTSHVGRDFAAIGAALSSGWYPFGGLVIDAPRFVSQSHPRLFIIACTPRVRSDLLTIPAFDRDLTGNRQVTNDLRPDRGLTPRRPMLRLGSEAFNRSGHHHLGDLSRTLCNPSESRAAQLAK